MYYNIYVIYIYTRNIYTYILEKIVKDRGSPYLLRRPIARMGKIFRRNTS